MKRILGLDLGTNSIGWALVQTNFDQKKGNIEGLGSRIIPMSQDILSNFGSGVTVSQTADRTKYRGVRRLYHRDHLRRERLHRVLHLIGYLPKHYEASIDFEDHPGQFKKGKEVKLPYKKNEAGRHEFLFMQSFEEMVQDFKAHHQDIQIPYDWTIYYLRHKALSRKITKEELAWLLLHFNQKRGYYQLRGEEEDKPADKKEEFYALKVVKVEATDEENARGKWYNIHLENGLIYRRQSKEPLDNWEGSVKEFIITTTFDKDGTPKLDASGNIKRSFRAVDSEKDWIAIKEKTEQQIKKSGKTVGSYIYETMLQNPSQKIRGKLINTIERKFYREELEQIMATQAGFHKELTDKSQYQKAITHLYSKNEGHRTNIKDKDFGYLFIEDIIFYQRPLKSKKSTIANCPYETRYFVKDGQLGVKSLKCIPKSHPLFQEFRLWQFIHNLKIYEKEGKNSLNEDVTNKLLADDTNYEALFDFLKEIETIDQKTLLTKYFKLKKDAFRWNYPEDKVYPAGETRARIRKSLEKIPGLDVLSFLTTEKETLLWHLLYSVKDKKEYITALGTFAKKNDLEVDAFQDAFKKFKPFDDGYGSYSQKALTKILPLMRRGRYWNEATISLKVKERIHQIMERVQQLADDYKNLEQLADDDITKGMISSFKKAKYPLKALSTNQACYAVYNRHAEAKEIAPWKSPKDIVDYLNAFKQHSLKNPIVEQILTETLRLVHDLWEEYGNGQADFFDEIHIELGRDMKNDKKTRERLSKINAQNENTNERIKNILTELMNDPQMQAEVRPYSKGHQELLKLYEEGVYANSAETYNKVKLEEIDKIRSTPAPTPSAIQKYKLWLQQGYVSPYTGETIPLSALFTTDYQIEHIIPRSRFFDDSLNNKIICESAVNELKDNELAYVFIKENKGRLIDLGQGKKVSLLSPEAYENHCKTYFKGARIKLEFLLSEDIPETFINRQLNDSRYISKTVKRLLGNLVRETGELEATPKALVSVTGAVTSKLKKDWGLNDIWERLLAPRFERMNRLFDTTHYQQELQDAHGNTRLHNTVPAALGKGFSKKRLDHRHHALDALVIATTTQDHINYLSALNSQRYNYTLVNKLRETHKRKVKDPKTGENKEKTVPGNYYKPWATFTNDALTALQTTVVSFAQNKRVINKTNNRTWYWKEDKGILKKALKKQKGTNWAIRKPMHKESVAGAVTLYRNGKEIKATAIRKELNEKFTSKNLQQITDTGIVKILERHLESYKDDKGKPRFDLAFNAEGLQAMNDNIQALNGGKPHKPIKSVRIYEEGNKFAVGETGSKTKKFVETASGANLFVNIYWNEKKQKRVVETVPLNEVIAHQKQVAQLPASERTEAPVNQSLGTYLFTLSPNDLVFVPDDEELDNPALVSFKALTPAQVNRIYKMEKASGSQVYFTRNDIAALIKMYDAKSKEGELGSQNKLEFTMCAEKYKITERCWKLKVNRLGMIKGVLK